MVKNKVLINSVFSVMISVTILFTGGCKSVREFGNGVYYNESNSDIKITITECKDTPENLEYDKECRLQFSDNYDFSAFEKYAAEVAVSQYWSDTSDEREGMSEEECEKLWNEVNEEFLNNLDVKKQLCEKPCSFYYVREDGESTASLYTKIDGTDYLSPETSVPFIIDIDENGALIINYSEDNVDVFV